MDEQEECFKNHDLLYNCSIVVSIPSCYLGDPGLIPAMACLLSSKLRVYWKQSFYLTKVGI